jgi:hypothetical protein
VPEVLDVTLVGPSIHFNELTTGLRIDVAPDNRSLGSIEQKPPNLFGIKPGIKDALR